MAEIKSLDTMDIGEINRLIGKTYLFCEGRTALYMIRLSDEETVRDTVAAVVVGNKEMLGNDNGVADVITLDELPKSETFNIVIADKEKEPIIDMLKNYSKAVIYIPTQPAVEELYKIKSNTDTRDYYDLFQSEPPLFKYIEIETVNRCNGICSFCPVNRNEKQRDYHKMSDELFHKIINELGELNYKGFAGLFSNNEPFLDERIPDFAKYARDRLPDATIFLISNGTLITEEKFKSTIKHLDFIQIDTYIDDDEPEPEYLENIRKWAEEEGVTDKMIFFRISPKAVRYSRGGAAPNKQHPDAIEDELCRLPLVQMVVRPDGKISLCCNDALGRMTLGDANDNSLTEIWNSKAYKSIREEAMRKIRY